MPVELTPGSLKAPGSVSSLLSVDLGRADRDRCAKGSRHGQGRAERRAEQSGKGRAGQSGQGRGQVLAWGMEAGFGF